MSLKKAKLEVFEFLHKCKVHASTEDKSVIKIIQNEQIKLVENSSVSIEELVEYLPRSLKPCLQKRRNKARPQLTNV